MNDTRIDQIASLAEDARRLGAELYDDLDAAHYMHRCLLNSIKNSLASVLNDTQRLKGVGDDVV